MKLVFAGTPEFAAVALEAIIAAGHTISLVLTQPDRPAGRGMQLQPSAVKQVALRHGLPVFQPEKLRDPATHGPIIEAAPDIMVVAAYGIILPQAVLDIPKLGCINIHASLLPRWRGAAPIQRAIEAGDPETGTTIMLMDAGLDTGPILLQEALAIAPGDTAASLHDKLAALGARLITDALAGNDSWLPQHQPEMGVKYAAKISKNEARVNWNDSATQIERRVRAFDPFPGVVSECLGTDIKIWQAEVVELGGKPGTVLQSGGDILIVACGEDALSLKVLQKQGGKRMGTADFLHGFALQKGATFA